MTGTRTKRLRRTVLIAAIAVLVALGTSAASAKDDNAHAARPFTIGVIGDMPYTAQQEAAFQGFMNAMSADWHVDFRAVETVLVPSAAVHTLASFEVLDGEPGVRPV